MQRRRFALAGLVLAFLLGAAAPPELPTVDQLKAQLDSNPQEVQRSVSRLLALKGEPAKAYDRYELFCLRGEASLRAKTLPPAADAFAAAAKETTDPDKKATARANEVLIRRSKISGYVAKPRRTVPGVAATKPAGPMPIINDADRKVAMAALFADEMAVAEPKIKAASNASALPPVIEAARPLADLNALEKTATGAATQTLQISSSLGKQAHVLIDAAVDKMSKRTEEIWASASRQRYYEDRQTTLQEKAYGLHGLTSVEANDLKGVVATCEKVAPVAQDLAEVTGGSELGGDATAAEKLRERAYYVLHYDYPNEGRYTKPPPGRTQQQQQQQQQPKSGAGYK